MSKRTPESTSWLKTSHTEIEAELWQNLGGSLTNSLAFQALYSWRPRGFEFVSNLLCSTDLVLPRGLSAPQTGLCILHSNQQQESAVPRPKKTWGEKMKAKLPHHVILDKDFAGILKGSKLHISCPIEVATELKSLTLGTTLSIQAFRCRLAEKKTAIQPGHYIFFAAMNHN